MVGGQSPLSSYKDAVFSNFATIKNSQQLIDALTKPDNSRFYTLEYDADEMDSYEFVIDISADSARANFARFNTIFKGSLMGKPDGNGNNPTIRFRTGYNLDDKYYGVHALLRELNSAYISNIDFVIEINDNRDVAKAYGSAEGDFGLLATKVYMSTFENCTFEVRSVNNKDIVIELAYDEREQGLHNVDKFGLLFGAVYGTSFGADGSQVYYTLQSNVDVKVGNAISK